MNILSPTIGLNDPTDLNGYTSPTETTIYNATAVDTEGCKSKPVSYFSIEIDAYSLLESNFESAFGDSTTTWIMAQEQNGEYSLQQFKARKYWPFFNNAYRQITSSDTSNKFEYYLREDKNSGKVWYDDYMYPIMDLSLVQNDTLFWKSPVQSRQYAIVDSVYYWNDFKIIQFDIQMGFANKEIPLRFIEGVGPNVGYLYQLSEGNQILLCVKKDGKLLYFDDIFSNEDCELYLTNTIEENPYKNVKIYPNPSSSVFTIEYKFQ